MLVRVSGDPFPPAGIEERLREVDPSLGMVWMPLTKRWGITVEWAEGDKRRQMVRSGELGDGHAYDILTILPEGITADDAFHYLLRVLKRSAQSKAESQRMLDRIHLYNKKVQERALEETTALAEELIATNAPTLFRDAGKSSKKFFVTDVQLKKSKPKIIAE